MNEPLRPDDVRKELEIADSICRSIFGHDCFGLNFSLTRKQKPHKEGYKLVTPFGKCEITGMELIGRTETLVTYFVTREQIFKFLERNEVKDVLQKMPKVKFKIRDMPLLQEE